MEVLFCRMPPGDWGPLVYILPAHVNSRVEDKNQRKRRYQERVCGTEVNLNCEYVQQLARVSAYRYYYRSRGEIPQESYVRAADRKVIRDAAKPVR